MREGVILLRASGEGGAGGLACAAVGMMSLQAAWGAGLSGCCWAESS